MYTQEQILSASVPELMEMCEIAMKSDRNKKLQNNNDQIIFRVGIGRTVFAKAFGFCTMDYYNDMELCLKVQLQWKLWNFYVMQDDTPFDMNIGIDYATAYEPSLYGVGVVIEEGLEPTYGRTIIKEYEDFDKLEMPDFFESGLMPKVHEQYRELKKLSQGRFNVFFPGFSRGPWSIATILRGFNELFLDMMDEPEFVHKLMQYCVDSRIHWEKQRCEFLGIPPTDRDYRWKYIIYRDNYNSDSFEDEVNGNMFSADMFNEYILPYEIKMAEFYGGIGYYHSCGSLTNFLDGLAKAKIFGLIHVSAWTDYEKAIEKIPQGVVVQVSLDAAKDVMYATEDHMRERIRYYIDNTKGRRVDICPDAIYEGGQETLDKVLKLRDIYREEMAR